MALDGAGDRFSENIERHGEGRAAIFPFALDTDAASMKFQQRLRNGQPEAETAELPDNGDFRPVRRH